MVEDFCVFICPVKTGLVSNIKRNVETLLSLSSQILESAQVV